MRRSIKSIREFDVEFKKLNKKFRSLKNELTDLSRSLINTPKQGINLGSGFYKIRLGSQSKGGGFRVITYYIETKNDMETVYLISIYDKSEFGTISKAELLKLIADIII
jgi:hypothetical protein